jgi:hypothetical protein
MGDRHFDGEMISYVITMAMEMSCRTSLMIS